MQTSECTDLSEAHFTATVLQHNFIQTLQTYHHPIRIPCHPIRNLKQQILRVIWSNFESDPHLNHQNCALCESGKEKSNFQSNFQNTLERVCFVFLCLVVFQDSLIFVQRKRNTNCFNFKFHPNVPLFLIIQSCHDTTNCQCCLQIALNYTFTV